MKLLCLALGVVTLGGAGAASLPSAPPASPTAAPSVSLAASTTDLRSALRSFAQQAGARILIGPQVSGQVTLRLANVPLTSALQTVTAITKTRWSVLYLPDAKAAALTTDEAIPLVRAAETLMSAGAAVGTPGGLAGRIAAPPDGLAPVYLVEAQADVAAARTARAGTAQPRPGTPAPADQQKLAAQLSPEAGADSQVVSAYTLLQGMSPDQIGILAKEYLVHITPEMRQAINDAIEHRMTGDPRLQ